MAKERSLTAGHTINCQAWPRGAFFLSHGRLRSLGLGEELSELALSARRFMNTPLVNTVVTDLFTIQPATKADI